MPKNQVLVLTTQTLRKPGILRLAAHFPKYAARITVETIAESTIDQGFL
jgi:hypothetical protein